MPREVARWVMRISGIEEWLLETMMVMYNNVRTVVKTKYGNSEELEV